MVARAPHCFQPRKTPVQARSAFTVEAIHEATIQVLLELGAERLTTIRVAARAGVSVGTLYQYYPNKQSLLFAVLERHLQHVVDAVERACEESHDQPLKVMVEAVVGSFLDAKLRERDTSVALYQVSSGLDAETLIGKMSKRLQSALARMLRTAPEISILNVDFAAFLFLSAMAGATRAVLEQGAPAALVRKLPEHLILLGCAYLASAAEGVPAADTVERIR